MRARVLVVLGLALAAACGDGGSSGPEPCSLCTADEAAGKIGDSCNVAADAQGVELQCASSGGAEPVYRCASRSIAYNCSDGVTYLATGPDTKLCSFCTESEAANAASDHCASVDDGSDDNPAGPTLRCTECGESCQKQFNVAGNDITVPLFRCASRTGDTVCFNGVY